MGGDLISRSALIKDADKHFGHPNAFYSNESFKELIGNQPTSYNVDKVVEQLEERLKFYENRFAEMSGTDRAGSI